MAQRTPATATVLAVPEGVEGPIAHAVQSVLSVETAHGGLNQREV